MIAGSRLSANQRLAFHGDEIHVWRVALDLAECDIAAHAARLSADEHDRAARFRMSRDRRRFIAARGSLRSLLGRYLELDPAEIAFRYGPRGKPALQENHLQRPVCFNIAHSADAALIAVRESIPVGVDIEWIRRDFSWRPVARRFFCPAEMEWLETLAASDQHDGFFTLWTRKEAFLKAQGEGVWHDLSRFDVTRSPVIERDSPPRWHLCNIDVGGEFKGAAATDGRMPNILMRQWLG